MKLQSLLTLSALSLCLASSAMAELKTKVVQHQLGDLRFESTIVYPETDGAPKPGILMIPNWMGPSEGSLEKAKLIAGDDYVVMMADVYSVEVRPQNGSEAGAAASALRSDRALMRERVAHALDVFVRQADSVGLDPDRLAAIGFCFGGGAVLEFARSGAELDAVVSFHGDLISPTLEADAAKTQAKVLVLHGAADPYVPQSDVDQWISVMLSTGVDWQFVQYAEAVHSFTNPDANSDGSRYHERTAKRAYAQMYSLFAEIW